MADAEENYAKLAALVPVSANEASQLLDDGRRSLEEILKKQHELDELSAALQRLRHSGVISARCVTMNSQMNTLHSSLLIKLKVPCSSQCYFGLITEQIFGCLQMSSYN
jgi:hypothetical protein